MIWTGSTACPLHLHILTSDSSRGQWAQRAVAERRSSSSRRGAVKTIAQTVALGCLFSIIVLGVAIYLYSAYVAASGGWIAVLLTLALPVVAQIYWIAVSYLVAGVLFNTLLIACLAWLLVFLLGLAFAALAEN